MGLLPFIRTITVYWSTPANLKFRFIHRMGYVVFKHRAPADYGARGAKGAGRYIGCQGMI
jgi:hypothetical protein